MSRTRATLEQRKEQLQKKLASINAKLAHETRKIDTRRKVLIGAMYLEKAEKDEELKKQLLSDLNEFLTRENDRSLFQLD